MPLTPLDLTFVEYTKGDRLGKLCALLSCAPPFLLVSLATLLASRRDLATLALACGLLASAALSAALKPLIRQPRPQGFGLAHADGYEHGMPSSHALFCAFAGAHVACWALSGRWREPSLLCRLALAAGALAGAAAVAGARVYLHYHTAEQVAVGGALGAALGAAWFAATEALLRPHFAALAATPLARWLRVRDCSAVDVLRVEYEAVAGAASAASKAH
jgi:dolichyldiphosphatase